MTDIELINQVKDNSDNSALIELINRHTGIYISIVQNFSFRFPKIQLEEIKDDRIYNIYEWIRDYKEDKGTKLSTYIGERTKYMCLDILNQTPDKVEITDENEPTSCDSVTSNAENDDLVEEAEMKATLAKDDRFVQIFKMRHPVIGRRKTWRQIGKSFDISHERARQIYKENINPVQKHLNA